MIAPPRNRQFPCRLCGSRNTATFCIDTVRPYIRCAGCNLIFVPEPFFVSADEEKIRYGRHTNFKGDRDYEAYLSAIADEVLNLPVQLPRIMDFGSGPQHVLCDILNLRGALCLSHDPLYGLDAMGTGELFDIVVACESVEHVRDLPADLKQIARVLKPEGFLYIHTQLYDAVNDFSKWWYIVDITHINFFCVRSMDVLGEIIGRKVRMTNDRNTVVFQ